MSKVIKGRGKILFYDEKDREKMNKKYPEVEFEKMNPLIFTTTYKGNKQFEVEIQVKDTKIPCSIQKWAWPWKYGTKVELRLYFKDLKKKAITHITGGIQGKLFKFFRYDYEKILEKKSKGGATKTFKKEQKKENKEYYQSIKKCRKIKDKKQKTKCYIRFNNKRSKTLKILEKKYPKEWKKFVENY